jgi:2-iminobutanoate/2-iminopropanoate deaminase
MPGKVIHSNDVMEPLYPYFSQAVKGTGTLVFVSGQTWDPKLGAADINGQARHAIENIKKLVETAGGKLSDVVKVTVFARNIEDLNRMAGVRLEYFKDHPPASTFVEVSKLWHPDVLVEIDAIAMIGS